MKAIDGLIYLIDLGVDEHIDEDHRVDPSRYCKQKVKRLLWLDRRGKIVLIGLHSTTAQILLVHLTNATQRPNRVTRHSTGWEGTIMAKSGIGTLRSRSNGLEPWRGNSSWSQLEYLGRFEH